MKQHQEPTISYLCTKKKEGMVGELDLSLKSSPHWHNYTNAAIRVYISISLDRLSREMGTTETAQQRRVLAVTTENLSSILRNYTVEG